MQAFRKKLQAEMLLAPDEAARDAIRKRLDSLDQAEKLNNWLSSPLKPPI